MKQLIIMLFSIHLIYSQCNHEIQLFDSFGDGWDFTTLTVEVNGVIVLNDITIVNGSGPEIYTFLANSGDDIHVYLTNEGDYPEETSFTLIDGNGQTLANNQNPSLFGNYYTGFCLNPDSPCSAVNLELCTHYLTMDNTIAGPSGIAAPPCGNYAGGDQWFTVTVPSSGELQVELKSDGLTDMAMALYTANSCGDPFTLISCDENTGYGNMPVINATTLSPGSVVYIRTWDEFNDESGSYTIEARDLAYLFCFSGDATDMGDGCSILTTTNSQTGGFWDSDDVFDFTQDFTHDFTINLGSDDAGADGIAFVMHNDPDGLATTGLDGQGLGAEGIENSLIIEIDTYTNDHDRNDGLDAYIDCFSGEVDHLDIWLNGNVNPYAGWCPGSDPRIIPNAVPLESTPGTHYNIENGLDHILRIQYDASSGEISAEILDFYGLQSYGQVSYILDPIAIFGSTQSYYGFTGSTGSSSNIQSVCLPDELNTPLPIELLGFNVELSDDHTGLLEWFSASEIHFSHFEIYHQTPDESWQSIGKVEGAQAYQYHFQTAELKNGTHYFKLKMIDLDGSFKWSEIKSLKVNTSLINIYPNPVTDILFVEGLEDFIIKDQMGRTCTFTQQKNDAIRRINISHLNPGIYFIIADSFNTMFIKR